MFLLVTLKMSVNSIVNVTSLGDFKVRIGSDNLCVVHFWADWANQCGPMDEALKVLVEEKDLKQVYRETRTRKHPSIFFPRLLQELIVGRSVIYVQISIWNFLTTTKQELLVFIQFPFLIYFLNFQSFSMTKYFFVLIDWLIDWLFIQEPIMLTWRYIK